MKFTLGWLKEHLETDRSLDEIVQGLTALGLEMFPEPGEREFHRRISLID